MKTKHILNSNLSINCKSPYYYLSKYRSELMGLAILWVVWFHSSVQLDFFHISFINKTFSFLKDIGYGGVDVFLLVSGMGIYNSLEKNDISKYIKNRIKRITPVWWSFLIISVLLGYFFFHIHFSKLEILGFATFTGFWIDMSNQGNWYVYAIMLFYLVSPIFYSLIKNSKNRLLMTIVLIAVALLVSVPFIGFFKIIVFSRVPIFLIGMFVSSSLKDVPIKKIPMGHHIIIFYCRVICSFCILQISLRLFMAIWVVVVPLHSYRSNTIVISFKKPLIFYTKLFIRYYTCYQYLENHL